MFVIIKKGEIVGTNMFNITLKSFE